MWNRRSWGGACASALLTAALPTVNAQVRPLPPSLPPRPLVILAADSRSSLSYLPLTIAERLGYFASEGLRVEVRDYGNTAQSLQAVLAGEVQALAGPYLSTIQTPEKAQPLQSFVLLSRASQVVLGVSTRTFGSYREFRDLQGKRIGIDAVDSASHRLVRMLLARAGLQSADVEYLSLPTASAAVDAFRSAQIDALCYSDLAITQLERGGDMRVVVDTRTVQGNAEVFGGPWPSACLVARESFLSQRPQHGQALANAIVHALKWLQTAGPSDINKVVPEWYFHGDRGLYLAAFSRAREAWTPDGLMPERGPDTVIRNLLQLGDAGALRTLDLRTTYTNEFALKAKAKFKV